MKIMNNTPKLRFKEFNDEWNDFKINKRFNIYAGGDLDKKLFSPVKTSEYMYPVYSNSVVEKGLYGYYKIAKQTANKITVTARGTLGIANSRKEDFTPVGRLLVLEPKEDACCDIDFIKESLNSTIRIINEETGVPQLTAPSYGNYKISAPSLPEQKKIASFLSLFDQKIELQDKKVKSLKKYKKGMMQKIFSQEIRFKDENGENYPEWKYYSFEKLFQLVTSKPYQIYSTEILKEGDIEVVDQGRSKIAGYSNESKKIFKDLPVIIYGDHTTNVKYRNIEFVVGADGTKLLKNKRKEDNLKYLYYALDFYNIKPEGYRRHFSILKEIDIKLPSLPEQEKIASFLSTIDKKIELEEKKLEKLKEYKKGLLQQMFV